MKRLLPERDDGFTLVELLVAIVIMGIIALPLGYFVFGYFHNATQTQQRLSDSHDIQIASAYFSQDVGNTGLRTGTSYTPVQSVWVNSAPPPCANGLGNAVLLLKWDNWSASSGMGTRTTQSAAYVVESGALHRVSCSDTTLQSDVTVAHNYVSASVSCSPANCGSATPPTTISLTIGIKAGPNDASWQNTTLIGQRRQPSS